MPRRSRRKTSSQKVNQEKSWHSSSPQRPPNAHFYCRNNEGQVKWTISFCHEKAPARWLRQIIDFVGEENISQTESSYGEQRIITLYNDQALQFGAPDLFHWLEVDPKGFEFPEDYQGSDSYRLFPSERWWSTKTSQSDAHSEAQGDENTTAGRSPRRKGKNRTSGEPRAKSSRPKAPSDFVTATQLAQDMGIDPRALRKALRSAKLAKPDFGWAFDPKTLPKLKKTIKEHLK